MWRILKYFCRNTSRSPLFPKVQIRNLVRYIRLPYFFNTKTQFKWYNFINHFNTWMYLYFSIETSTLSLDLEFTFTSELATHSFVPYRLVWVIVEGLHKRSEDWIHFSLRKGFIVFKNLFLSVIWFNSNFEKIFFCSFL